MEATEEITCAPHITKGRRTKRQRLLQSSGAMATSSSSSVEVLARTAKEEEEEDMANCLILLAQGHASSHLPICPSPDSDNKETATAPTEKISSRGVAANGKGVGGGGFYAYECKTCNKCFPSFQALGGHRTSHKKSNKSPVTPAWPVEETKTAAIGADAILLSMNTFSGVSSNGKIARTHECSICGSVFASGQALGGHMRRHRPAIQPEPVQAKKVRSNIMLTLDLNLPAPSEDYCTSPSSASAAAAAADFSFTSKPPLLLPRSALIDCHY